jgi:hypothetical protein
VIGEDPAATWAPVLRRCGDVAASLAARREGKVLYAKTEAACGLLIPFHTLEEGASCAREIPRDKPIAVMLHYTACPDLPRRVPLDRTLKLIARAAAGGFVSEAEKLGAQEAAASVAQVLDGGILAGANGVPDAIAQAAIAAWTPREACGHYYVASCRPGDIAHPGKLPVVEFVSPDRVAHHCGPLTGWWNRHTVGIEVCYPGPAPRATRTTEAIARRWYRRRDWSVPDVWVALYCSDGVRRWFAPVGAAVVDIVVGLVSDLCLAYPTIRHLVAHSYAAPSKRIDPDPPISLRSIAHDVEAITGRPLAVNALKR